MSDRYFPLVIANGQQNSNEFRLGEDGVRGPMTWLILSPDTLLETVTIEVAGPLGLFRTLQSGGVDIVLPADKATQVMIVNATAVRVHAASATGGDRLFEILWNTTNRL